MITVIGSLSMDFVVQTARLPEKGETFIGESFKTFFGGKGANQAVAIGRLGHPVAMIGCVGDETFGVDIINNLKKNNVDTTYVKKIPNMQTGTAHIFVEDGDNRIVVVGGANDCLDTGYIAQMRQLIAQSSLILIQYEIPTDTIDYIATICEEEQVPLVINPAPMKPVATKTLEQATYITPNELEVKQLYPSLTLEEALLSHPEQLVVTMGETGVAYSKNDAIVQVPANKTAFVDTTGAGDAFNGGFVVGIAEGLPLLEAIEFGNLVASHAIKKLGAQSGLPYREDLICE